ncbi:MAG: hypothetical protein WD175_02200 [Candidatus Paceibacterota bacterium]
MKEYRGVIVRSDFRLTSQNPGQGHSVTEPVVAQGKFSMKAPKIRSSAIEKRIAQHMNISIEEACQLFLDLQMFLWMAAQSEQPCVPAPLIDDAWHEFLVYTREYEAFCAEYCGGFMHHQPHLGEDVEEVNVDILSPTIDLMHQVFGGKPNTNWDYVPSKEAVPFAA